MDLPPRCFLDADSEAPREDATEIAHNFHACWMRSSSKWPDL